MEDKTPVQNESTTENKAKKKSTAGLIILIVCIALTVFFATLTILVQTISSKAAKVSSFSKPSNHREIANSMFLSSGKNNKLFPSGSYIARIYITGTIQEDNKTYNQKWLLDTISSLENDQKNKGIILILDTPGGAVYESDEAYLALKKYQETGKPVWSYMTHMAASGGYYIACGSQYICANRNTLTGSIGVIAGQSFDATALMENVGIKSKTFTAGKNKNMLNFNCPLTKEQESIMQSIADECYEQFTSIVATNRKLDKEYVQSLADGRIYTANQALQLKLIDKVCSYEDAINTMKTNFDLNDVEVFDYVYSPKLTWMDMLTGAATTLIPLTQSKEERLLELATPKMKYPAFIYGDNLH